jgi:hypothetical protein
LDSNRHRLLRERLLRIMDSNHLRVRHLRWSRGVREEARWITVRHGRVIRIVYLRIRHRRVIRVVPLRIRNMEGRSSTLKPV